MERAPPARPSRERSLRARPSAERSLIDAFLRPFGRARNATRAAGIEVGAGLSDCAVLRPSPGMQLVATTDAVVEGVHFDRRWFSPEDIGWKALAVNLSDLAAAGARPRWFLCALGVPRGVKGAEACASRMARGMAVLARRHGCAIAGGNVTAASEWSVTITALGEARHPLTRKGARPGDALVVAGKLGDAALALAIARRHFLRSAQDPLRVRDEVSSGVRHPARGAGSTTLPALTRRSLRAQLRPTPLVEQGLAAAKLASAAIDVSDGFLGDLAQLAHASGCGAVVDCAALPLGPAARRSPDGLSLALSGGEDYALLFAVPRARLQRLLEATDGVEVGRFVRGSGIELTELGVPRPLPADLGFDHLR